MESQDEALAGQLVQRLAPRVQVTWRLVARSGVTTAGALDLLDGEAAERFDVALTALGVNDATRLRSPERFAAEQARLGQVLRSRFGVGRLIRSAVPPLGQFDILPRPLRDEIGARALALDAVLQGLSKAEPGAVHLPFDAQLRPDLMARDGFHPGAALYSRWAQRAAEAVLADSHPG